MRPISTYNTLNVVGSAFAPASSLSRATIHSTIKSMANPPSPKKDPDSDDKAVISDEGRQLAEQSKEPGSVLEKIAEEVKDDPLVQEAREEGNVIQVGAAISTNLKAAAEEEKTEDLEERDEEVRERAEKQRAAAGPLASGSPVYEYEVGPDGKMYAVSGHVNIKVREGNTPEERLKNAERAERAANAGGEITPKSARIATDARREAQRAREEIEREKRDEDKDDTTTPLESKAARQTERTSHLDREEEEEPGMGRMKRAADRYEEMQNSRSRPLD